jgi:hypothetical protein
MKSGRPLVYRSSYVSLQMTYLYVLNTSTMKRQNNTAMLSTTDFPIQFRSVLEVEQPLGSSIIRSYIIQQLP